MLTHKMTGGREGEDKSVGEVDFPGLRNSAHCEL